LFTEYTDLAISTVTQRQSLSFSGTFDLLRNNLLQLAKDIQTVDSKKVPSVRVFNAIDVSHDTENKFVILEWIASPLHDVYADAVLACILQLDASTRTTRPIDNDLAPPGESLQDPDTSFEHFKECVMDTLQEMFGRECVPKVKTQQKIVEIVVNEHKATLDFDKLV
jgi:cleavage and polyadenylation specificity factor subunit 3